MTSTFCPSLPCCCSLSFSLFLFILFFIVRAFLVSVMMNSYVSYGNDNLVLIDLMSFFVVVPFATLEIEIRMSCC